jgi:hypothetical protein
MESVKEAEKVLDFDLHGLSKLEGRPCWGYFEIIRVSRH